MHVLLPSVCGIRNGRSLFSIKKSQRATGAVILVFHSFLFLLNSFSITVL